MNKEEKLKWRSWNERDAEAGKKGLLLGAAVVKPQQSGFKY